MNPVKSLQSVALEVSEKLFVEALVGRGFTLEYL
mgnify:CR=1 FL=1